MKKIILLSIINLIISLNLFAQVSIPNFIHAYGEDNQYYIGYNNRLFECDTYNKKYRDITELCYIDNNGFLRINYIKKETTYFIIKEEPHYLILSPKQFFIMEYDSRISVLKNYSTVPYGYDEIFIKRIYSNLYLVENSLEYAPVNLLNRFFSTDREFPYEYWSNTLPLAISKEQMDQFELDVDFKSAVEGILLLNGFVDLNRPHLYKNNRRIREIIIADKHNQFLYHYTLEDIIQFQEIKFPQLTDGVRIRIVSYYEGNKYTDICLSAITPIFNEEMRKRNAWIYGVNYEEIIYQMLNNFEKINN